MALLHDLVRAERNGHIHAADFPLHPGSPVEPHVGVLKPGLPFFLELLDSLQCGFGADTVGSVRVGQVACHEHLVRAQSLEQVLDDVEVSLGARHLLHAAGLVERQVEEVDIGIVIEAERTVCPAGLAAADGSLDGEKFLRLRLSGHLGVDDCLDTVELVRKAELMSRIHVLENHIVVDGEVSGCLISHVDIVSLMNQADECTSHGNHIVIRMRRENEDLLRIRLGRDRPLAVIGIRFSARPSGNGMLEVIEHVNVYLVIRPPPVEQLAERMLEIIFLCKLENRLVNLLAKPYDSLSHEFPCPVARSYHPRRYNSRKEGCAGLVGVAGYVRMSLEQ